MAPVSRNCCKPFAGPFLGKYMNDGNELQRDRLRKPPLFPVDAGIDRLVGNLPGCDPDNLNDLRTYARLLTREVSAWMIRRGQERQRNRLPERMAR